jgi:hypothetical protein
MGNHALPALHVQIIHIGAQQEREIRISRVSFDRVEPANTAAPAYKVTFTAGRAACATDAGNFHHFTINRECAAIASQHPRACVVVVDVIDGGGGRAAASESTIGHKAIRKVWAKSDRPTKWGCSLQILKEGMTNLHTPAGICSIVLIPRPRPRDHSTGGRQTEVNQPDQHSEELFDKSDLSGSNRSKPGQLFDVTTERLKYDEKLYRNARNQRQRTISHFVRAKWLFLFFRREIEGFCPNEPQEVKNSDARSVLNLTISPEHPDRN